MATVLECHYDMRAGRAMAFGAPSGKHFRIRYNYNANGELHEGEFYSEKAIPQNTLFPIRYNPAAAHENSLSASTSQSRSPMNLLLAIGIIGAAILTLAWFAMLRGCY